MKNKIYIFGIVLLILFTIGAFFKINHWPGAAVMISLSLILFSLVFCPMALASAYRAEKKHAFIYFIGGITIAINFIGALFKILHWPGAAVMLTIGIVIPFILFLPAFLIYQGKKGSKSIKNLVLVLFLLVYISAMDAMLALNVSKDILEDSMLVNDHYELLAAYYEGSSQEQLDDLDSSAIEKGKILAEKTDQLVREINQLKTALVLEITEENADAISKDSRVDIHSVIGKDNTSVSTQLMMGENRAQELKQSINAYKDFLKELSGSQYVAFIDKYLNTEDFDWEENEYTWEEVHFEGALLVWAINHLTSLEFRLRMVEAEIAEAVVCS